MNYLLLSIIIISLVGILMIPNAFAVKTVIVQNAAGSSNPGCEETNLCFDPNPVIINVQDKITWENNDSASHTVTSGNPTTGPLEYFDSGLMMPGDSYSLVFPGAGTYDYFCMVHPWMEGKIIVNAGHSPKMATILILDPLPDTLQTTVENKDGIPAVRLTVSGKLTTADGGYVTGATIRIVPDNWRPENPSLVTGSGGKFENTWILAADSTTELMHGNHYGVHVVYDGSTLFEPSKSQTEQFFITSKTLAAPTSGVFDYVPEPVFYLTLFVLLPAVVVVVVIIVIRRRKKKKHEAEDDGEQYDQEQSEAEDDEDEREREQSEAEDDEDEREREQREQEYIQKERTRREQARRERDQREQEKTGKRQPKGEITEEDLEGTYYDLLRVSKDASQKEIKTAYRKLINKYHPDKNPKDKFALKVSKKLTVAYSVLSNQVKRKNYDEELNRGFA